MPIRFSVSWPPSQPDTTVVCTKGEQSTKVVQTPQPTTCDDTRGAFCNIVAILL